MKDKVVETVRNNMETLRGIRDLQKSRYRELKRFAGMQLHPGNCVNNVTYYCVRNNSKAPFRYAGNDNNNIVKSIKEARFLALSLQIIEENIELAENFIKGYKDPSFEAISKMLPKSYRMRVINGFNPVETAREWKEKAEAHKSLFPIIHPENLTQPTIDGKYVRSKSEAMIYNHLTEAGYTFVYELPIQTRDRIFYPDFTILSEIDYETVILIEHQGMLSNPIYRENAEIREFDYWKKGYLPGREVYFTYDDVNGRLDMGPIDDILRMRVRPVRAGN